MKIKWRRIFALILALAALAMAVRHREPLRRLWDSAESAFTSLGTEDDRFVGFLTLGGLLVAVVAMVRLLRRT